LRTPFGNVINVLGRLFCTTNHVKVIGKRKPFKTNNSSVVLYGLLIFNAPTWKEKDVMNALGKSYTAIHVIHNCAEYNLV